MSEAYPHSPSLTDTLLEQLAATESFIRALAAYIDGKRIVPRQHIELDNVLLALISKAVRIASAVVSLVREGFGDEAFGLSRSLIDVGFSVRYIANDDSIARAKRYIDFLAKDHEGWTKLIPKYYPHTTIHVDSDDSHLLEIARTFKSPHSWTGLGNQTKGMAMEADTVECDDHGKPICWEFDYEIVYKWTSHYVHCTAVAIGDHCTARGATFSISSRENPSRTGRLALFNSVQYLCKICICSFRPLGISTDNLDDLARSTFAVFLR